MTTIDPNGEVPDCSDSGTAEVIGVRPGMKLYDEYGNFVCELGEPRKVLTEEERQRNR
jgi:hypothetical protein